MCGRFPLVCLPHRTPQPLLALFRQVYVYAIVGRDFYKQFRVWIISFTKTVL